MNYGIEEIQRQYTYAVQPVKFFETQNSQIAQQQDFDFISRLKTSCNNPFHPSYENTNKGGKLDLMG